MLKKHRDAAQADAAAVAAVLGGDREAFEGLARRHYGAVFMLCLSVTGNRADAEDAAQEAFISAFRRLDRLRQPGRFRAWIGSIARNAALNQVRTAARRRNAAEHLAEDPAMNPRAETQQPHPEENSHLRRLVEELPQKTREVMCLFYFEEMPIAHVAAYVGRSENAVKNLLRYGRKKLRDRLEAEALQPHKELRARPEALAILCAKLPQLEAPWAIPSSVGPAAPPASLPFSLNPIALGGLLMNVKHFASALAFMLAIAAVLFWWQHGELWGAKGQTPGSMLAASMNVDENADAASSEEDAELEEDPAAGAAVPASLAPEPIEESEEAPAESGDVAEGVFTVTGRVEDPEGNAMPHFELLVQHWTTGDFSSLHEVARVETDAAGNYEVAAPHKEGSLQFASVSKNFILDTPYRVKDRRRSKGGNVWIGGQGSAAAERLDLTALSAGMLLTGHVLDTQGQPIAAANATLFEVFSPRLSISLGYAFVCNVTTDARGRFEMPLPEGTKQALIEFSAAGFGNHIVYAEDSPVSPLDVVLEKAGGVAGKVTGADGRPAANVWVAALEYLPHPRWPVVSRAGVKMVQTDPQGKYQIDGLSPSLEHMAMAFEPGEADLRQRNDTVQMRAMDAVSGKYANSYMPDGARFDVDPERTTQGVSLTFLREAVVRVRVLNEQTRTPVEDCGVGLGAHGEHPYGRNTKLHFAEYLGEGRWEFRIPIEGVQVFDLIAGVDLGNLEHVTYADRPVELAPGVVHEQDILVPPSGMIRVRILASDAHMPKGANCLFTVWDASTGREVGFVKLPSWPYSWPAHTREVESEALVPEEGMYRVGGNATGEGLRAYGISEPVHVAPGEPADVVVHMRGTGFVEGRAVRPDGTPFANTEVGLHGTSMDRRLKRWEGSLFYRMPDFQTVQTGEDGYFSLSAEGQGMLAGLHPRFYVGEGTEDPIHVGMVENVELREGEVTNLGTVVLEETTAAQYDAHLDEGAPLYPE